MRREFLLLCLALGVIGGSSSSEAASRLTYVTRWNGEEQADEGRIVLEGDSLLASIRTERSGRPIPGTPREVAYFDFVGRRTIQVAALKDSTRCSVESSFDSLPKLDAAEGADTVLGYVCAHATTVVRSNHIDLWFAEIPGLRGSPALNLIPEDAVVLRMVRNGSLEIVATEIELDPSAGAGASRNATTAAVNRAASIDRGAAVDLPTYRARVTASYVTEVPIFSREQIAFGNEIENPAETDSSAVFRYAGGTVIARRVTLPDASDDAAVFADIVQYSNGDAYDRTGSVFLIPTEGSTSFLTGLRNGVAALPILRDRAGREYQGIAATDDYAPPIELVRFITPFGVRHYNEQVKVAGLAWEDSAVYRVEVTDLLPRLRGSVWIGAFIGNYDKGGHRLSLTLRYHPGSRELSDSPRARRLVEPLFCTLNLMEMAGQQYARLFEVDTLRVSVDLAEPLTDARLRYITTGHGGWDRGDEFLPKVNELRVDGRVVARFVPWRSDCEGYRRLNPASGNFWNGQSSSDLSRSGWCPGAAVSPMTLPLGDLTAGRHLFEVAIDMGAPVGESASGWNVSGSLLGELPAPSTR